MTSRAARAGQATRLLAAAALVCGGCTLLPRSPASPPHGQHARAPLHSSQPRPTAAAAPPLGSLLPFPPARLQTATSLAGRFTADWDSWSWRQPPPAWPTVLQPIATSLEPALAQAAGDRGVLALRAAGRQTTRATVTGMAIRDLTPGSVTVTVTAAQVITGSSGTSRSSPGWAVTLTPEGSGWLVRNIEPAGAGNS